MSNVETRPLNEYNNTCWRLTTIMNSVQYIKHKEG